jgi:hypothetical protein
MDIYENVVIGSFLYALGLEVGAVAGQRTSMSVNLLQQMPLDAPLADVALANMAFFRLIEFKRTVNRSSKEPAKRSALTAALSQPESRHYAAISREIHWYVETGKHGEWTAAAVPYIDFGKTVGQLDFLGFVQATAHAATGQQLQAEEVLACKAYLRFVAALTEGHDDDDTGCILITGGGGASVSYTALRSLRDLLLSPRELLEHTLAHDFWYGQDTVQTNGIEPKRVRGRGLSQRVDRDFSR